MSRNDLPGRDERVEIYRRMSLIKLNDDRFIQHIKAGRFATPYYSPRGQEAIPAAYSMHLRNDDYLVTTYRGLHDQLAKGVPLNVFWAEFAGKATGTCKGKGGPMHITHPASGVMVTTGIVGSGLPIANGLAWASQLSGNDRVTICCFGDGASNIGAFHEALNLASVWKLPVIFICQNNGYAEHTSLANGTSVNDIAARAVGYSMASEIVDGNDPVAVWQASGRAIARARAGEGPTLLEAKTFRFHGHLLGDDSHYIPRDEMTAARSRDPLPLYRATLIAGGHATEAELDAIDGAINRDIDAAVEFSASSPYPDPEETTRDVLAA